MNSLIIKIDLLTFTISFSQGSLSLDVQAPIVIGSIPLRSQWGGIAPPSIMPSMVSASPVMPAVPDQPMPPGMLPPANMQMAGPYVQPGMFPPANVAMAYPQPMHPEMLPLTNTPMVGQPMQPGVFPPGNMPTNGQYGSVGMNTLNKPISFVTNPPSSEPPLPEVIPPPVAPTIIAPYPDMPPPAYNECFGEGVAVNDDDDNSHIRSEAYKPLYPTYTWN